MIVRRVVQLANGTASLLVHLPLRAAQTFDLLPPDEKARILAEVRRRVGLGEVREPSHVRALPFIALGILGVVAINVYRSLR